MQVKMNLRLGSLEILNENSFRLTALLGMTAPKSVLLENTTVQLETLVQHTTQYQQRLLLARWLLLVWSSILPILSSFSSHTSLPDPTFSC